MKAVRPSAEQDEIALINYFTTLREGIPFCLHAMRSVEDEIQVLSDCADFAMMAHQLGCEPCRLYITFDEPTGFLVGGWEHGPCDLGLLLAAGFVVNPLLMKP